MTLPVHPLDPPQPQPLQEDKSLFVIPDFMSSTSPPPTPTPSSPTPTPSSPTPTTPTTTQGGRHHHQQRAYSVTAMPSELQKSVLRSQEAEHQEKLRHNQPWWQYYYQLYHYQLPPGRKPTVFGPYLLLQTLGEGEFGKVKFGIEVKTGQEVAIKLIRKDSIDSSSRMTKVEREISVLRILHHPNIVELFDVIETEKYIGIILQCATGGELFDYILAHRYLKERDASRLFAQLISGVHYMHQKHIVHRDLKLENLLLDRHRNVLITDFGFANQFSSAQHDLMSTSCGSPCYAAPELVMNQGVYVGPAVDIWSCGVILFAMLCGYLPYDDDPANPESYNINLLYKYILNTPLIFPDYISDEACDLLSLMLVPDPEKRCSMDTIMSHPWLAPHKHLFVTIIEKEVIVQVQEEIESTMPDQARRNTIANIDVTKRQEKELPKPVDIIQEEEEEEEAIVPEMNQVVGQVGQVDQVVAQPVQETLDTTMQETHDTTMQDITSIELPPPTITKDDTLMTKDQVEAEEELHGVPPLPTTSSSIKKIRPKSNTSTEKVLNFLSGHSNTPKPPTITQQRNTIDEKRTRHMSLATVPTVDDTPPAMTSILQAKFLSSIHQRNNKTPESPPTPILSASTPHPTKTNKRNIRLSSTSPPSKTKQASSTLPSPSPPTTTTARGTRRKTLSLLVNSMTDNKIPFTNRRQSKIPAVTTPEQPEQPQPRAQMMPSVSEHTMHTLSDEKEEKHRSAGKKLMDWFKKKPLSTMHRSTHDNTTLHTDRRPSTLESSNSDLKLRMHHGAVDQEALSSRPPQQVFLQVKQTLKSLGLEFKRDGGEYKLKCTRPKKAVVTKSSPSQNQIQQQQHGNNTNTPFRMLLRRPSSSTAAAVETAIYGDPNVDPGEEVKFSIELCKIKNLPGLYIVDMRRMRGNVWAYKFIYRTLLDTLNLGGKSGYLNTTTPLSQTEDTSQHRMSTASSGGGSSTVLLDDHTTTSSHHTAIIAV